GATSVWANVLYLRPGTREHVLENLARDWPELLPTYERLYAGGAYVSKEVGDPIRRRVDELRHRIGIEDRRAVRLTPDPAFAIPIGGAIEARGQRGLGLG